MDGMKCRSPAAHSLPFNAAALRKDPPANCMPVTGRHNVLTQYALLLGSVPF